MIAHLPVMVKEVVEVLNIQPGGTYVDATVGLGGHAGEIVRLMNMNGRIVGIDRDDSALRIAGERLRDERVILRKGKFSELREIVRETGIDGVDGVLFDFGVSMMQLRDLGRGFSFSSDAPLDMRMDASQDLTAEDVVNTYPERELERILREYGEERFARRIARTIVAYRARKRIVACNELADIAGRAYRTRGRIHPATRTFQALRVAVNDELSEIERGLGAAAEVLRPGGRLCAISYHSLEDRAVKVFMRKTEKDGLVRIITKKPLTPSAGEMRTNPSSRSAKLRGAERL